MRVRECRLDAAAFVRPRHPGHGVPGQAPGTGQGYELSTSPGTSIRTVVFPTKVGTPRKTP